MVSMTTEINVLFDREVCPSFWEGFGKICSISCPQLTIFLLCHSRHPFNKDNAFLESLGKEHYSLADFA